MSPSSQYQHPYDAHFIELALREADRAAQDAVLLPDLRGICVPVIFYENMYQQ